MVRVSSGITTRLWVQFFFRASVRVLRLGLVMGLWVRGFMVREIRVAVTQ